ncbi:MAG: PD-(D/E)XK nuclease family protein, partial [Clostridiales bacterium]|nr:PD-(D/E)XK nuclease family protein [Clostridiales bacterium]
EMFSYEYPYKNEAGRKSKYSVSELKHESMLREFDQNENEAALPKFLQQEKEPYIPSFAAMREMPEEKNNKNIDTKNKKEAKKLPGKTAGLAAMRGGRGALTGTAFHRIMLGLDFAKLVEISGEGELSIFVKNEIERIKSSGKIPEEIAGFVVPSGIERFAASTLAHRMAGADTAGDLYREKPFVMRRGDILVQGIIDAFWIEDGEIVLLDYKTDNVKAAGELIKRYKMQLDLYADALTRLFSTEEKSVIVKEKLIYSSHLGEVISL